MSYSIAGLALAYFVVGFLLVIGYIVNFRVAAEPTPWFGLMVVGWPIVLALWALLGAALFFRRTMLWLGRLPAFVSKRIIDRKNYLASRTMTGP